MIRKFFRFYAVFAVFVILLTDCGRSADNSNTIMYGPGNTVVKNEGGGTILAPNFALSYFNSGMERYASGNFSAATGYFTKALEKMKGYENSYSEFHSFLLYHRGLSRYRDGEREEALTDYDAAVASDPKNYLAFFARGLLNKSEHRFQRAIADFSRAIDLKHDYASAYNNRGVLYAGSREEYGKAIQDFTRAFTLSPAYYTPIYNLAKVYALKGDSTRSLHYLNRAVKLSLDTDDGARRLLDSIRTDEQQFGPLRKTRGYEIIIKKLEDSAKD